MNDNEYDNKYPQDNQPPERKVQPWEIPEPRPADTPQEIPLNESAQDPQPVAPETPAPEPEYTQYSYPQPNTPEYNYLQPEFSPQQQVPVAEPPKKKRTGMRVLAIVLVICLLVAGIGGGITYYQRNKGDSPEIDSDAPQMTLQDTPQNPTPTAEKGQILTAEQVAAKVRPSVVGVLVYGGNSTDQLAGEGSGILMAEDDAGKYTYVITCAHVVSGSYSKIFTQLENGKQYEAVLMGRDTRTDLAVLRIEASGLTIAEFGNSDNLKIGSTVYAVGNPGGIQYFGSITDGIVSAIGRNISSSSGYTMECIQHSAPISPGNSGGALVNEYGQVIGINSMKIMGDEYENIGFAIPTSTAMNILNQLIQYKYVPNRPKLGIKYYSISDSARYSMIAQANNLPAGSLIIGEITADSSLANTKAQQYDIITAVDGEELDTADVLLEKIEKGKVGDTLKLTLCRISSDYKITTFDVNAKLIEDTGDTEETSTMPDIMDPFSNY